MAEEKKPTGRYAVGQQATEHNYFIVDTEKEENLDTLGALVRVLNELEKIKKSLG